MDSRAGHQPWPGGDPPSAPTAVLLVPPSDAAFARRNGARVVDGVWTHSVPLPPKLRRYAPPAFSPEALALQLRGASLPAACVSSSTPVRLRPHQDAAVAAILAAYDAGLPGFLLADEVGLGKTFSTVGAILRIAERSNRRLRVLVVAPLSVVAHWRRTLRDSGTGNAYWCVTNYEKVKDLLSVPVAARGAKRRRTRNKRHASEGRSRVVWDVVVVDEAHRLKNPLAQRSRALRRLVATGPRGRRRTPAFTLWLSATAGQDPLELSYLAPLLAARSGSSVSSMRDFPAWFADQGIAVFRGPFGSWEYRPGPGDEEKVRSMLFDPWPDAPNPQRRGTPAVPLVGALRRRPVEVAGWPELVRMLAPVELGARSRRLYELAWEEFRRALALDGGGTDSRNALVAALRFRQKASLLRVDGTVQAALDAVEDGLRPAVSAQFRETIDAICRSLSGRLRVGRVDGSVEPGEREAVRVAFQRGELDAVVFSVVEGISLHAGETAVDGDRVPRVLLLHDLRWSALETAQIEGRTHRDGQAATARYLYAEDTVEESMVHAVLEKLSVMGAMLGDDLTALDALLAAAR